MARCPVPGCPEPLPFRGFLCADHFVAMPVKDTQMITRLRFKAERTDDDETRRYLKEQAAGYLNGAIRKMGAAVVA